MTGAETSPIAAARALPADTPMVLLYSGMKSQGSGSRSFLAHGAAAVSTPSSLAEAGAQVQSGGRWFGYLGYELGRDAAPHMPVSEPSFVTMPSSWLMKPEQVQMWEHEKSSSVMPAKAGIQTIGPPDSHLRGNDKIEVVSLNSNFSKSAYLDCIEQTLIQIRNGAFYQANITRKFWGTFESQPDTLALFENLCAASPAPFAAYIRTPHGAVISSSPESFIQVGGDGRITARPIKGTARRGADAQEDESLRAALADSAKDRAENLMIVDLMRNDLSRVCAPGSVEVSALHEVHTFETVHQMISTVQGKRRADASLADVLTATFPPGSMTGAPKIAAMRWCAAQEKLARGIYSGTIGWLDASGTCDLSVVIRTLVVQGNRFEFQVGGGIVADSDPEAEWRETLVKARGICAALGIEAARLEGI